jgi:cytochrome P450
MNNTPPTHSSPRPDNIQDVQHNPLEFLTSLSKRGDVVPYATSYGPVYLINHPDHIRQVLHSGNYVRGSLMKMLLGEGLLASEGDYWRRQRRLMQPVFHQQKVAAFDDIITKAAAEMLERWQELSGSGEAVDVATEMTHLTLRIVGKALFSVELQDHLGILAKAVKYLVQDFGRFGGTLFGAPYQIDSTRNRRFAAAMDAIDGIVHRIIQDRRRSNEKIDDLLSMLIEGGEELDDRRVRDEIVTMLFAGHVTTANILTWTWYLLSRYPAVELRLHGELARVLGGRPPVAQDVPELCYTRMILQESLRLYPPVWFIARKTLADDEIDGHRIAANTTVVVSPYLMHRDARYWDDPEQFNPERFSPEASAHRPASAYLPFAAGQHICIGNHVAMLEGQLVLAMVSQRYRLRLVTETAVEPEPALTLGVRGSVPMTIEERFA